MLEFFHNYLPSPVLVEFGPLAFHWYGLMMALGIALGYGLVRRQWRVLGWQVDKLDKLIIWLVISGLIGARLIDVFVYEWWYFKDHLIEIFYVWQGGLAWHGGLIGALPVLWWWSRRQKFSFWQMLDSFAPGLALGQALGRWGNYFNQELFGLPTSLPWGIPIAVVNRPAEFAVATHFHPTFLYESIGLLFMAYLLWQVSKRIKISGSTFAFYLILTGLLRFALEFIRIDEQSVYLGWRAGFIVALLTVIVGLEWWRRAVSSNTS